MCGLAGIVDLGGAPVDRAVVARMTRLLAHRGPDDQGFYFEPAVGLGHRRLSILDLSVNGRQPMSNEDGSVWLVFNGEIYNFRDLRQELVARGHHFRSHADSEVIVHGYEEWGDDCWRRLDGFFALVLWDARQRSVHLVRDPFAIKPLLYRHAGDRVLFGSELKALLGSGEVAQQEDRQALADYLTYFYIPGPQTILEGVQQVPPGHCVRIDRRGATVQRFWRLEVGAPLTVPEDELLEQVRAECRGAVEAALVSDVPVGLLLSGGIDSNIILRELVDLGYPDIQSITVGFRQDSFDESDIARRMLADLGLQGHFVYVEDQPLEDIFERMVYHVDCLNANVANLAEYFIFQAAAPHVKVALAGMGNDELFAGYATYRADVLRRYYRWLPRPLRRLARAAAWRLPPSERKYGVDYLARKFTEGAEHDAFKAHYWWRTILTADDKRRLLRPGEQRDVELEAYRQYDRMYDDLEDASDQDKMLYADLRMFCMETANALLDNLSMAFSIEVRPPFLSKRFVEFAFRVPYHHKLRGSTTKRALRSAYDGRLPDYVTKLKKSGLVSPLAQLIRGPLRELTQAAFEQPRALEAFDRPALTSLLDEHMSGRKDHGIPIYVLLNYLRWHERFIADPAWRQPPGADDRAAAEQGAVVVGRTLGSAEIGV